MSRKKRDPASTSSRPNSHDVARRAGVSQSAVSRALNDRPGVSAATRAHVAAVAAEMGYRPNALAQSLSTQRSGLIGVIVSDLANPFLNDALDRIMGLARARDLQVMLFGAEGGEDAGHVASLLGRYPVELSLMISPHLAESAARNLARLGPTVILFNRLLPGMDEASAISVDDRAAGAMVAGHLLARGHRAFGYLHGLADAMTDRDRFEGYSGHLVVHGAGPPVEAWGEFSYEGGARAVLDLLTRGPRPTALFCANDAMAMGVMDVARLELGLAIPDDLAVVGFDDAPPAAWRSYALTTVRQPVDEILTLGLGILGDDGDLAPRNVVLPAELIQRRTS